MEVINYYFMLNIICTIWLLGASYVYKYNLKPKDVLTVILVMFSFGLPLVISVTIIRLYEIITGKEID